MQDARQIAPTLGQKAFLIVLGLAACCSAPCAQTLPESGLPPVQPVRETTSAISEKIDPCAISITSDDAYQFKPAHIDIAQDCKDITVTLKHIGRLPKAAMGHNWVLVKKSDMAGVAADGMAAGEQAQYLAPGDKRVIAATKVIGGGQTTSITFRSNLLQPNETYGFLCTFGGHSPLMQGSLSLVPSR